MFFQRIFPRLSKAFLLSALTFTLVTWLSTVATPASLSTHNFDNIYVLGDSLSDDGNLFQIFRGVYPQSPPYFKGRFSNGPVWVEYLAPKLGLTPNPKTNFASGGSSSGVGNSILPKLPLPGLIGQVSLFTALFEITLHRGDPNSLYIVWAGADDYLFGGVTDINKTVNNLLAAVRSLAAFGAKNIMVINLPDLGKLPGTRGDIQISTRLSTLTSAHNSALAAILSGLSQTLSPNVNLIPIDVNYFFNRAIAAPREFGFTNVTDPCLVGIVVCANPNKYLFWDYYHPTTATHKILADLAFSALESH